MSYAIGTRAKNKCRGGFYSSYCSRTRSNATIPSIPGQRYRGENERTTPTTLTEFGSTPGPILPNICPAVRRKPLCYCGVISAGLTMFKELKSYDLNDKRKPLRSVSRWKRDRRH